MTGDADMGTVIQALRGPVSYLTYPVGEIMAERRVGRETSRRLSRRWDTRLGSWINQVKKGK